MRPRISRAHLSRSGWDIQSGTSSSSTPARSRAETVRRRLRVATMRIGGMYGDGFVSKTLCSVCWCGGFGAIVGGAVVPGNAAC